MPLASLATSAASAPPLVRFGLSPHADLVFRLLTSIGPQPEADVCEALQLSATATVSALDELSAAGAITAGPGNARHRVWYAHPPADAIAAITRHRARAGFAARRLQQQLARLEDLAPLPVRITPGRLTEIHGTDRVRARLSDLVAAERHEHLSMSPTQVHDAASVRAAAPLSRMQFARGVRVRSLGVPAGSDDPATEHGGELRTYGVHFRELDQVPTRLIVIDRQVAILPLDPAEPAAGAWEVTDPVTVDRLLDLFHAHWDRAREHIREWTPPMSMNPRERAVIALMAAGHTDASIAAKLRISVRTVAYTVSGLMERYQTDNRFQLGLVLGAQAEPPRSTEVSDEE